MPLPLAQIRVPLCLPQAEQRPGLNAVTGASRASKVQSEFDTVPGTEVFRPVADTFYPEAFQ